MICEKCPKYSITEKLCDADILKEEVADNCLLKMMIMQLWFLNIEDTEGDEWKFWEDK